MNYIDKTNALKRIMNQSESVILELGCGNSKLFNNSIAIDMVDLDGVDIICDINKGLSFIPDNSIDEIYSSHFLEHVSDFGFMMKEIYRILKPNGIKKIIVPHFSNPYFYSDYTHKNHFGLYSLSYFSKSDYFKRSVPVFYNDVDFEIIDVKINFKSKWKINNYFAKFFGLFVNSNRNIMEFYESNWCYKYPARELIFLIRKKNV